MKRRLAILALAGLTLTGLTTPKPVVVASKPFGESYLLAEMFAQLLEAHGFAVERKLGLGATELAFQALRTDAIDLYPEYTGTGLTAILHEAPSADPREAFNRVATEFSRRWGIRWLPPLGFENTYAIAVRPGTASEFGLRTLSPRHIDYHPKYYGDLRSRDAAYHQGTVWPWLLGPFVDAWRRTFPDDTGAAARFIAAFAEHLDDACVGSISEIFDAEPPYVPRGCVAQAWSVAELLRCAAYAERDALGAASSAIKSPSSARSRS